MADEIKQTVLIPNTFFKTNEDDYGKLSKYKFDSFDGLKRPMTEIFILDEEPFKNPEQKDSYSFPKRELFFKLLDMWNSIFTQKDLMINCSLQREENHSFRFGTGKLNIYTNDKSRLEIGTCENNFRNFVKEEGKSKSAFGNVYELNKCVEYIEKTTEIKIKYYPEDNEKYLLLEYFINDDEGKKLEKKLDKDDPFKKLLYETYDFPYGVMNLELHADANNQLKATAIMRVTGKLSPHITIYKPRDYRTAQITQFGKFSPTDEFVYLSPDRKKWPDSIIYSKKDACSNELYITENNLSIKSFFLSLRKQDIFQNFDKFIKNPASLSEEAQRKLDEEKAAKEREEKLWLEKKQQEDKQKRDEENKKRQEEIDKYKVDSEKTDSILGSFFATKKNDGNSNAIESEEKPKQLVDKTKESSSSNNKHLDENAYASDDFDFEDNLKEAEKENSPEIFDDHVSPAQAKNEIENFYNNTVKEIGDRANLITLAYTSPEKLLKLANGYAKNAYENEKPILIYDNSVGETCKSGFFVTDKKIYAKNSFALKTMIIEISDLQSFTFQNGFLRKTINFNGKEIETEQIGGKGTELLFELLKFIIETISKTEEIDIPTFKELLEN